MGFIQRPKDSRYFYHADWQSNGSFRYFVHTDPQEPPHSVSTRMNTTLYCIENDGFTHARIDLNGDLLSHLNYTPETAVQILYGGLKTYAKSHLASSNETMELTLDLGEHSSHLFELLMADVAGRELSGTTASMTSASDLPVQQLQHKLFNGNETFTRNSPTQYTFIEVRDGVIYCDPITARMIRGARGIQGSDEAVKGDMVADLQRAGKKSVSAAAEPVEDHGYPDSVVDAFNTRQWQTIIGSINKVRMTYYTSMKIGQYASVALSEWLGSQLDLEPTALQRLIEESFEGGIETDLHFDTNGFIIGAVVHKTAGNNKRGTTYEIGDTKSSDVAKRVWLTDLYLTDKSLRFAPMTYDWSGTRGNAYKAFLRWFYRSEFAAKRQESLSQEIFGKSMNSQPSMTARLAAMDILLGSNAELRDLVVERFCKVSFNTQKMFDSYYRTISESIRSSEDTSPSHQFMALYMELCLRNIVGNETVDHTIAQQL